MVSRTISFMSGLASDFAYKNFQEYGFVDGLHFVDPEPESAPVNVSEVIDRLTTEDVPDEEFSTLIEKLPDVVAGESITGLKSAMLKERKRAQALERQNKQYEQFGDPDEIQRLKTRIAEQEQFEDKVNQSASAKVAELRQQYEPQILAEREAKEAAVIKYQQLLKRSAVERWFNKSEVKGIPSEFDNFYALTEGRFNFDPDTNAIQEVYDRQGKIIYVDGKVADPSELMLRIRKGEEGNTLAGAFEAYNRSSGGGMPSGLGTQNRGQEWRELSTTDKFAAGFSRSRQ